MLAHIRHLFSDPASELFSIGLRGRNARPRDAQGEYALAVAQALGRDPGDDVSVALLQADTGIGKSVGYIVPALVNAARNGGRVVVSTHTIALQDQIMTTLPGLVAMIEATEGRTFAFARRIGRRNFVSIPALSHLVDALRRTDPNAPSLEVLDRLLADITADDSLATIQAIMNHYGRDLRDAGGSPFSLEECRIGQYGGDDAAYLSMLSNANGADVLVVNHALLTLDIMTGGSVLGTRSDDRPVIYIIDEADALPDVVERMLSRRLPFVALRSLYRNADAAGIKGRRARSANISMLESLEARARTEFDHHKFSGSNREAEILPIVSSVPSDWRDTLTRCLVAIQSDLGRLEQSAPARPGLYEPVVDATRDVEALLEGLAEVAKGDTPLSTPAMYWTPARRQPGLLVSGGQPGMITSNLWRKDTMKAQAIVLTSATLSGSGDGEATNMLDLCLRIGMSKAVRERAIVGEFAPTDFGRMDFVIVDQNKMPTITIPRPEHLREDDEEDDASPITNPEAVKWWAGMIRAAVAEDNGRVLVLPTSYARARLIAAELGHVDGWQVFMDAPGHSEAVAMFEDTPKSILIAPGRWAGLDLPGKVRHIVAPSIPFAPPDTIQNETFERFLHGKHGTVDRRKLYNLRFPANVANARRKFRQALGRGIRQPQDVVTIWIGDGRWPATASRRNAGLVVDKASPAGRAMVGAIPRRFRDALEQADGFDLERGRFKYARPSRKRRGHDLDLQ